MKEVAIVKPVQYCGTLSQVLEVRRLLGGTIYKEATVIHEGDD
jgi:hypothetical protein